MQLPRLTIFGRDQRSVRIYGLKTFVFRSKLRLQPKGCTHKGYLREVGALAPIKGGEQSSPWVESVLSGARMHADSRAVVVPLKRRRG